jgi:hypothetical protein
VTHQPALSRCGEEFALPIAHQGLGGDGVQHGDIVARY